MEMKGKKPFLITESPNMFQCYFDTNGIKTSHSYRKNELIKMMFKDLKNKSS